MVIADVKMDCILTFFRNSSFFIKPHSFPSNSYDPGFCSEVNLKLSKLTALIPYSEQERGVTLFSLRKALPSRLPVKYNHGHFVAANKYYIETSVGYWAPLPYVSFVEREVESFASERERDLVKLNKTLHDNENKRLVVLRYRKFLGLVSEKTEAVINYEQYKDNFYSYYEGLKACLSDSDLRKRYARPLCSLSMLEILCNQVTTDHFVLALAEKIYLRINQPSPEGIAKLLVDLIGGPIRGG